MGLPITIANFSDATAAEAISQEYLILKDAPAGFFNHPAMRYCGTVNGGASAVKTVPHVGLGGYDLMLATAEGTAATTQTLTTASSQITVARYTAQRELGDFARMVDATGVLRPEVFAQDAYAQYVATVLDLAANIIDGFTLTQTASTIMTVDDFSAAVAKLGAKAGPLLAVLHPKQWGELVSEIATTGGGAISFAAETPALISTLGPGFKGRLLGVDVFVTESVISSGGDRKGAILAPNALVWANAIPVLNGLPGEILVADSIKFTVDPQATKGTVLLVSDAYVGVSMGMDSCGVTLSSDA